MYMTIEETAEYLDLPADYITHLVHHHKIKTVHDGTQFLINKHQFNNHLEQMEKYRDMIQAYLNEPIPEDPDIKDED
ncbi:excisionase family DNA-binding protein [Halobacillus sp. ACCC02827]|uniref:excisionase family DNA-binding protein n=1 Tax=Bacillaceae TaxID=186817 RepID=UPI0002A5000D|nr:MULTISPECIES: excisionase family DNA-binding protein [Bacillaceae]ELK46437.1 excisionase family DNA binding domain [Halobacillus sp. BAB-2008]QHT48600.1 excisionase family DNA-binding protein [Bacillus sp. SB49]WJE17633.1 excisionase family DNA-binding protein [Halobacillus sp. ACCC02827]